MTDFFLLRNLPPFELKRTVVKVDEFGFIVKLVPELPTRGQSVTTPQKRKERREAKIHFDLFKFQFVVNLVPEV